MIHGIRQNRCSAATLETQGKVAEPLRREELKNTNKKAGLAARLVLAT